MSAPCCSETRTTKHKTNFLPVVVPQTRTQTQTLATVNRKVHGHLSKLGEKCPLCQTCTKLLISLLDGAWITSCLVIATDLPRT